MLASVRTVLPSTGPSIADCGERCGTSTGSGSAAAPWNRSDTSTCTSDVPEISISKETTASSSRRPIGLRMPSSARDRSNPSPPCARVRPTPPTTFAAKVLWGPLKRPQHPDAGGWARTP
jgi:hypothetical protein